MSQESDSEDIPQLSSETFAALQEFYREQDIREEKLNQVLNLKNVGENLTFEENWQLSQFWYNNDTTETLVKIAMKCVGVDGRVALVSCPTLFKKMKETLIKGEVKLLEYDQRFSVFGDDFIFYDYNSPLNIPRNLESEFDLVIADPPFLSEECLTKIAVTVKYLSKNKIILCTGSIMAELAERLLCLQKCNFEPRHQNNLANEFWCYSNFDVDTFL